MTETKQFPLRAILTVTTGLLLTKRRGPHDNGIGDLYEILGWMTGDSPFTHQLPRFADECRPEIFRQHPRLDDEGIRASLEAARDSAGDGGLEQALAGLAVTYGEELPIGKLPKGGHVVRDPVRELHDKMRGGAA